MIVACASIVRENCSQGSRGREGEAENGVRGVEGRDQEEAGRRREGAAGDGAVGPRVGARGRGVQQLDAELELRL